MSVTYDGSGEHYDAGLKYDQAGGVDGSTGKMWHFKFSLADPSYHRMHKGHKADHDIVPGAEGTYARSGKYSRRHFKGAAGSDLTNTSDVLNSDGSGTFRRDIHDVSFQNAVDSSGRHVGTVYDGTHSRTMSDITATVNSGGGIDFGSVLHLNKDVDHILDGIIYGRHKLDGLGNGYSTSTWDGTTKHNIKGVGDAQTLNIDSEVIDGTTYGRHKKDGLLNGYSIKTATSVTTNPSVSVIQVSPAAGATGGSAMTATFAAAPTQGNLLIAFGYQENTAPTIATGWTMISPHNAEFPMAWKMAGASEPTTQTPFTNGATGNGTVVVTELFSTTGWPASPIDVSQAPIGTSGTPPSISFSVTSSQTYDAAIFSCFCNPQSTDVPIPAAPGSSSLILSLATVPTNGAGGAGGVYFQNAIGSGSYAPTLTYGAGATSGHAPNGLMVLVKPNAAITTYPTYNTKGVGDTQLLDLTNEIKDGASHKRIVADSVDGNGRPKRITDGTNIREGSAIINAIDANSNINHNKWGNAGVKHKAQDGSLINVPASWTLSNGAYSTATVISVCVDILPGSTSGTYGIMIGNTTQGFSLFITAGVPSLYKYVGGTPTNLTSNCYISNSGSIITSQPISVSTSIYYRLRLSIDFANNWLEAIIEDPGQPTLQKGIALLFIPGHDAVSGWPSFGNTAQLGLFDSTGASQFDNLLVLPRLTWDSMSAPVTNAINGAWFATGSALNANVVDTQAIVNNAVTNAKLGAVTLGAVADGGGRFAVASVDANNYPNIVSNTTQFGTGGPSIIFGAYGASGGSLPAASSYVQGTLAVNTNGNAGSRLYYRNGVPGWTALSGF